MSERPKSQEKLVTKEAHGDPLAAFDTVLDEAAKSYKKIMIEPKEREKQEKEAALEFTSGLSQYLEKAAKEGSYDELKDIPFDYWLRLGAEEAGNGMPADFEGKSQRLAKVKEQLNKYENLLAEIKSKPEMKAAADGVIREGGKILREWAGVIKEQMGRLSESRRFELEETDQAIREILDSPIMTCEIRPEKETHEQYEKRFIREMTDAELDKAKEKVWEKFSGQNKSPLFKDIKEKIREGKMSYEEIPAKIQKFLKAIEEVGKKPIEWEEARKMYLTHYKEQFGDIRNEWDFSRDFRSMNLEELKKFFNELQNGLDVYQKTGAMVEASLGMFVEEKLKNVIAAVEDEFESKEEQQTALEYFKKNFREREFQFQKEGDRVEVIIPIEIKEGEEKVPKWALTAAKEQNDIRTFKEILFANHESIDANFWVDQILRKKLGEQTLQGKDIKVQECWDFEGKNKCMISTTAQKNQSERFNLDFEPIIKAWKAAEMINNQNRGFYTSDNRSNLEHLSENIRRRLGQEIIERRNPFQLSLHKAEERELASDWAEKVEQKASVSRPTTREEVKAKIQANAGVYRPSTVTEAINAFNVLKQDFIKSLQEMKKMEVEAAQWGMSAKEKVSNLEGKVAGLEKRLEGAERNYERAAEQAQEKAGMIKGLESQLKEARAENARAENMHTQRAQQLRKKIEEETKRISGIKGFGKDGKQKDELEKLLENVQKSLG